MEFKIDENLPSEACRVFQVAGHNAVSVLDQRLGGRADADIVAICKSEDRTLVTLDTDFANILAYPPSSFAGIIVIRTDDQAKKTIMRFLSRIVNAVDRESPKGKLWIVELGRIRVRGSE